MDCRCENRILLLTKSQWEQLKDQADPEKTKREEVQFNSKIEYYKALDAQSKEWKKNWPDTLEGCLAQVERRKAREHARDLEFVKRFEEKERLKISNYKDAIAQARQKIFNTTCYGVQLISALRQSKDLEEREAQIEFNKFLKEKQKEHDKYLDHQIASMKNNMFDYAKRDDAAMAQRKIREEEHAKYNKEMHEHKEKKEAEEKKRLKQEELEDARLQQMNLDFEKTEMEHCKIKAIKEALDYEADRRAFRFQKKLRDQEDDALIAAYQRFQDRVKCGEKRTWEKIIKAQGEESLGYKIASETLRKNVEESQKAYDNFVQTGIDRLQARTEKKNKKEDERLKKSNEAHFKQVVEDYHTALEINDILKHRNKCFCERQSWVTKPRDRVIKEVIGGDEHDTHVPEHFLKPFTKFSDALKKRIEEPTPWTGLNGQHEYFAQQASATIKECKYKRMAKKVVDDYKKITGWEGASSLVQDERVCKNASTPPPPPTPIEQEKCYYRTTCEC